MKYRSIILGTIAAALLLYSCGGNSSSSNTAPATAGSADQKASELFSSKCAMCHDFKQDKIGPALSGVAARWNNDTEKMKQFIRNSGAVIKSGDPYATKLYEKWNQSDMPSFPDLSNEDLDALISYLK